MNTDSNMAPLTFDALRAANATRQDEWCPGKRPSLSYRGNELAGEVGEACNQVKKLERARHGWRGSPGSIVDLARELADVVICADLVALAAGIDLGFAVIAKFNETSSANGMQTVLTTNADYGQLARELAALKQAVVEACVTTSLSSVNVRWINERVIELMRESEREQAR